MRSSDQTHFRINRLHVVFAVASLALLAVSVWMVVADHRREWKEYQRTYRDRVEPWLTEARIRQTETEAFVTRQKELTEQLTKAQAAVPDRALVERFGKVLGEDGGEAAAGFAAVQQAYADLAAAPDAAARGALVDRMGGLIEELNVRQGNLERELRFAKADFDEARSAYEIALGQNVPQDRLDALQAEVDRLTERIGQIDGQLDRTGAAREQLGAILQEMTRDEEDARRALAEHDAQLERLQRALATEQPSAAKELLRAPLIDALGRPLAIEQIWLPDLTIDYNFRRVARFDRCTTCHTGIEKQLPESELANVCQGQKETTVRLARPKQEAAGATLREAFGLELAPQGMFQDGVPTVWEVAPKSAAADAGLWPGDVIVSIDGQPVGSATEVGSILLGESKDDSEPKPFELAVRRGMPEPYCAHPRLDLFVGSHSPHPAADFGCTICHDGQGSATEFKWASHSPNQVAQERQWREQHGWFRNAHWDYPMLPKRFAESRCLKCHHAVTDLNPTERFPDPPAPKLLAGYHLIRQNGCFGCHEIKGVDASGRSIGPDMRLGPLYAAIALELAADPGLTEEERALARRIAQRPDAASLRAELAQSLRGGEGTAPAAKRLQPGSLALIDALAPQATPGTMKKVGPALRDEAAKVDAAWLADRVANPRHYLPETRMPQFYGLDEQLTGDALAEAQRLEPVEIRAVAEYLLAASQAVEPAPVPPEVTEPASAERGKRLFQLHGCLACHKHRDFPEGQATIGPDLSQMGAKYTAAGTKWLVSWIRDPSRHNPRTVMPNALLEPEVLPQEADEAGKRRISDPVGDIAAYLLEGNGWTAAAVPEIAPGAIDELAGIYLRKEFPAETVELYLREGIPESQSAQVSVDAAELLGPISESKKLRYVGRRTIARRGCFGCHDIPGMELAQQIGPALSDWGRKQESLLAFEQVHRFLELEEEKGEANPDDPDRAFYVEAVKGKRRDGFIWEKLRQPRSFDYGKARNKPYLQWLTMGRFQFTPEERESIITFVLGLVADPPAARYVYQPDSRRQGIIDGQKVLDRYACAECHTLAMERWEFEYDPDEFEPPPASETYAFLRPHFTPKQIAASMSVDRRGRGRATVVGMPVRGPDGQVMVLEGDEEDDEGEPLPLLSFQLWEPAVVNGEVCTVGGADLLIYKHQILSQRAPEGGTFARLLYPVAMAEGQAAGATIAGMEPWGWVPPPLVEEGKKVQPAWLYQYLLDPTLIRPAGLLRMPRYNLTTREAAALVDYFVAAAGAAERPAPDPRIAAALSAGSVAPEADRAEAAMRIVTDRTTFCAKCHLIGDYNPGEAVRTTLAPDLEKVGNRLSPDYLRQWLADPRSALPYTGMPVNFPPAGEPLGQDLFKGSSHEQLDAVTRLLSDFRSYLSGRVSIRGLIESAASASGSEAQTPPAKTP